MIINRDKVNEIRHKKYISSDYIAKKLGISINKLYAKLSNGRFKQREIYILCEILDVKAEDLMLWKNID